MRNLMALGIQGPPKPPTTDSLGATPIEGQIIQPCTLRAVRTKRNSCHSVTIFGLKLKRVQTHTMTMYSEAKINRKMAPNWL